MVWAYWFSFDMLFCIWYLNWFWFPLSSSVSNVSWSWNKLWSIGPQWTTSVYWIDGELLQSSKSINSGCWRFWINRSGCCWFFDKSEFWILNAFDWKCLPGVKDASTLSRNTCTEFWLDGNSWFIGSRSCRVPDNKLVFCVSAEHAYETGVSSACCWVKKFSKESKFTSFFEKFFSTV